MSLAILLLMGAVYNQMDCSKDLRDILPLGDHPLLVMRHVILWRCFCKNQEHAYTRDSLTDDPRFIECEKWRKEFGGGVENLTRDFDYQERPKVFEYYPQYYHKTDKVCIPALCCYRLQYLGTTTDSFFPH